MEEHYICEQDLKGRLPAKQDRYNDAELEEFSKLNGDNHKSSLLEKALAIATGPVLGMLPPPVQRKLFREETAALMSKTSRYFNGIAIPAYALGALIAKGFGADIDPTPGNVMPLVGLASLIDSGLREGMNLIAYGFCHPHVEHLKVWGEPLMSITYSSLFDKEKTPETNPLS